jgi:UDP-glucose 4-epimerase
MSVLVVGGAGYIGSVTSRLLIEQWHPVVILDNFSKGHHAALPPGIRLVEGDLGDRALLREVCRQEAVDTVFHFAAFTEVGTSVRDPAAYFDNNSFRTKNLLDALVETGVKRFIFSSTAATYGEPEETPITEAHPTRPTNPYGWSKLFVEVMLRSYLTAYGLESVIFRYFNAAGAVQDLGEDHDPETHLIPVVLQVALGKREAISIFGTDWDTPDGSCVRDYVHVADLAKAHLLGMDWLRDQGGSSVFNLGNGSGHSVIEVVETARRVTGKDIPTSAADRRPGDPARLVASSEKARRDLGWTPDHPDLEDIIGSAWKWFQSHPNGYGSR